MSGVEVEIAAGADHASWTDYLSAAPGATLFHDWRWGEVIADVYGYETLRLVARRAGAVVGVAPLTDVRSPLLGRSLISTAFTVGGGAVADDAGVGEALADAARSLGEARRVSYVELRGGAAAHAGWIAKQGVYASFEKKLPANADEILAQIPRTRRAEIRKALALAAAGRLSIRHGAGVDEFYPIYARSLRDHGTPAMPRRFIESLAAAFADETEIALVSFDGAPVAALLSFWHGERVMPYYVGALDGAREARAFDYLYYQLMRRAVDKGAGVFDFGRSKIGSTHFKTKTYWGFEPAPLTYYVALVRAKTPPNVNPANPKFALAARAWKRLPTPLANAVGPVLARNFA